MHSNASDCERRSPGERGHYSHREVICFPVSRRSGGGGRQGRRANGHFASSHVAWMWCSATSLSSPLNTVAVMYVWDG